MEHSNSRTFQGLPKTFKDLLCFQGLSRAWNFFSKFKDFQGLLKDPMNPVQCGKDKQTDLVVCVNVTKTATKTRQNNVKCYQSITSTSFTVNKQYWWQLQTDRQTQADRQTERERDSGCNCSLHICEMSLVLTPAADNHLAEQKCKRHLKQNVINQLCCHKCM